MLVSLRIQPTAPRSAEDPFQGFIDCHQRIRTFAAMNQRLAQARPGSDTEAGEVAEGARRVERYFTVGMGKHVEDEDLSLAPRLRELELTPEVLAALETMGHQHRALEVILDRLAPLWRELQSSPDRLASLAPALAADGARFAVDMEAHLLLEERVIFPFARQTLPEASLAALGEEMRVRRAVP
jgi:hemerythrin-like domain-containing protein